MSDTPWYPQWSIKVRRASPLPPGRSHWWIAEVVVGPDPEAFGQGETPEAAVRDLADKGFGE